MEESKSFSLFYSVIDESLFSEFNEFPFENLNLGHITETKILFDENNNTVTEIFKNIFNESVEVTRRTDDNKIIKQTFFNSEDEIVKQFVAYDGPHAAKTFVNSDLTITFYKLKWSIVYLIYYKNTEISESYTITDEQDIIRSTRKEKEKITRTVISYANGDWYYASASGDDTKTIIMGKSNYLNTILQTRADGINTSKYLITKGIFVHTRCVGNYTHLITRNNNITHLFINNGIIINKSVIMINRYPPCVRRQFTKYELKQHFNVAGNENYKNYHHIICSIINGKRFLMENNHPPVHEIFTQEVTKWDACCNLEYKSTSNGIHYIKNNNFRQNEKHGNLEDIIDLGQACKYADDKHKIIWKKQEENSDDKEESSMGSTSH